MAVERKGVLLRLRPDLLTRVDVARGALSRTEWLVGAIEEFLAAVEVSGPRGVPFEGEVLPSFPAGAMSAEDRELGGLHPGLFARTIVDEDGSDLGLVATARADGALEISHKTQTRESGPAGTGAPGYSGLNTPHGELEGPDVSSRALMSTRDMPSDPADGCLERGAAIPEGSDRGSQHSSASEQGFEVPGSAPSGESSEGLGYSVDGPSLRASGSPSSFDTSGAGWPD